MAAKIKDIIDIEGNTIYPVTVIGAVYMPNGMTTVQDEIKEIKDGTSKTEFLEDGSIKKTLGSGRISTTTFGDGVITEVCKYADGTLYYTKTTTFNDDGSIDVVMTFEGED